MFDPDLSPPDICSIRAAAEQVELAGAARGLLGTDGCPPVDYDLPLLGRDRRAPYYRLRPVRKALASVRHGFKYRIWQLGAGGAWLVVGNREQRTGAGR
jgi:hypothetical protein